MTSNTLYRPKLESGLNATLWSPCSVYTSSLVKQTSDSIILEVDKKIDETTGDISKVTERVSKLEVNTEAISGTVQSHTQTINEQTTKIGQLELTDEQFSTTLTDVQDTVTSHTESLGQLQVKADKIEGKVEELEQGTIGENQCPSNGWKNKAGEFVTPTDEFMYYASASTITSPLLHLVAGTYCSSNYNNAARHFSLSGTTGTIEPTLTSSTTETYLEAPRYYEVYNNLIEGDYRLIYGSDDNDSTFYCPKLEENDHPTEYNSQYIKYSSLMEQTSKEISIKVKEEVGEDGVINKFKETGIDITSGKIELNADNTNINGNLQLHAKDDADALSLFDDNDVERTMITSAEIGALSGQSMSSVKEYTDLSTKNYGDSTIWDMGTFYYAAGTTLKPIENNPYVIQYIGYVYDSTKGYNVGVDIPDQSSCSLKMELVSASNTYTVPTTVPSKQVWGSNALVALPNGSVTIAVAGTYTLRVTMTWADGRTTSPYGTPVIMRMLARINVDASTKTTIGADGMFATVGKDKYMYYGTDGFRTRDTYYVSNNLSRMSSVGTSTAYWDTTTQSASDKYEYFAGVTGPTHMASFDRSNQDLHWVSSQQYGNVSLLVPIYNQNDSNTITPSTDVVIVQNISQQDSYTFTVDLSDAEWNGHIVTIRNVKGYCVGITAGSGSGFCIFNSGGYMRVFPSSTNFYSARLIYMTGYDSEHYYTKGCWYLLDIATY